ncbi:MAG: TldD/PmbA family protein [Clostridium sp.]
MIEIENLRLLREYIKSLGIKTECYIEMNSTSRIRIRNQKIEDISNAYITGVQIRFYSKGKKIKRVFSSFLDIQKFFGEIMAEEQFWGEYEKETEYDQQEKVSSKYLPAENFDEIIEKLLRINNELRFIHEVKTTILSYGKSDKTIFFLDSKGKIFVQTKRDIIANFAATIVNHNQIITYPISLGSAINSNFLDDFKELIIKPIKRMIQVPVTETISASKYTVILEPLVSGILIHEVLGHLLEADTFFENQNLLRELKLGTKIASSGLTVIDDPTVEGLRGSYYFDDEGVESKKTILVENGYLKSYLHSKDSAKVMNAKLTGNARALNYRFFPIIRMSNIFVKEGDMPFIEMIRKMKNGLFIRGLKGANVNLKKFTIVPLEAYVVNDGKIIGRCPDIYLKGEIDILKNIIYIGSESFTVQGYSCNKYAQRGLPVSVTAPYMCIERCDIEKL